MSTRGPSHFKELEDMLKTFRCQDLANLLAYANHSKNGKKTELFDRCKTLLEKGGVHIQMRIKEIYNSKNSLQSNGSDLNTSPDLVTSTSSNLMNNNTNMVSSSSSSSNNNHDLFGAVNSAAASATVGGQRQNYFNGIKNTQSSSSFNSNIVGPTINPQYPFNGNSLFKNEIKFKKLAFYEVTSEIVKPITLQPNNLNSRPYNFSFQFQLQCNHADEISISRHISDGKFEYTTQLQLRFALIESIPEQNDNFPPNTNVNVNGKPAQLPPPKPTSKPNADMIRPGRSVDITNICRLAPNMSNKIEVSWTNPDNTKVYCVSVFVVKKLTTQALMDRIKTNCKKPVDFTKQLVKEKLAITDNDLEIETSTLKASLLCPLMKCRIKIPGRSTLCKHAQCFDLFSYLSMNEKKPTWNCPVCDRHAPYEDLVIDSYFEEILEKCSDCEEIQFLPTGDWSRIDLKKKSGEKSKSTSNHVNISESPLKTNDIIKPAHQIKIAATNNNGTNPPPSKIVCVDLTLDSDDENDLCKKTTKNNNNETNNNNNIRINEAITTTPASPTASIISLSSDSSTPSQKDCNNDSATSSRSHSPNNLIINTDDTTNILIDKDLSTLQQHQHVLNINKNQIIQSSLLNPIKSHSPLLPPSSPQHTRHQQQSTKLITQNNQRKSPDQTNYPNCVSINDIKRSNSTISQVIGKNKNELFDINSRKNSTSSSSGSINQGNTTIINQILDESLSPVHSPLSPSPSTRNEHGLIKSSLANMKAKNIKNFINKEKATKLMEELHSNSQNTNYFLKDNSKIPPKNPIITSISTPYNNSQQQIQNSSKNYQITSNDNLKIRLTNNNSNYTLSDERHHQYQQQQQQNYNPLFPSIPPVNQLNNIIINKPQQQQQQLFHQSRGYSNNNYNNNNNTTNSNSSGQRTNIYPSKNPTTNIYQNSRSNNNNNIREPSGGSGSAYDSSFRYNQQFQQHLQQPYMHYPQQSTQISGQINNLFQNNSTNSSRHHSIAQSPPAHSHS